MRRSRARTARPAPGRRRRTSSRRRSGRPRRRSSCSSVTTSRAPLIPSGCPIAIAPPLTFTRLRRSRARGRPRATARRTPRSARRDRARRRRPRCGRAASGRPGRARYPSPRGRRPPPPSRRRLRAARHPGPGALLARDHERGGAVVDSARVARRDGAAGAEGGPEARELVGLVSGRGCSSRSRSPAGTSSSAKRPPPAPRPSAAATERERVLILTRDVPAVGDVLARLAHRLAGVPLLVARVDEAPAERRVVHRAVATRVAARPASR